MKSIRFRLLVAAIAVLLGTAAVRAQDSTAPAAPPRGHGHGYGMHQMHFFAHELNLTDTQKAQMKSIWQKEHPTMKPLMQQSHQIDMQLHQYVEGNFDEAKVRALATQKAQVEAELTVQQTRIHNEMYQLLTTDQQTKLKELEAQHQARMQQHMHDAPPAPPEQ